MSADTICAAAPEPATAAAPAVEAPAASDSSLPLSVTVPVPDAGADDDKALDQIEVAKPTFLHSPPDSNDAAKSEASDSELSELGEDIDMTMGDLDALLQPEEPRPQDDIGDIEPDHWSGTVPVFKPTTHQFKDFKLFMEKIDKYGMKSGIVKIIPPQEWKDSVPAYDDLVKQVRVREPIKQDIMGSNGTYRQVNILHQRSYNLPQWRQLCDQSEHQPPARRGERRAAAPKPAPRPRPPPSAKPSTSASSKKRGKRGRPPKNKKTDGSEKEATAEAPERPMTPVSPKEAAEGLAEETKEAKEEAKDETREEVKEEVIESVEPAENDPGENVEEEEPNDTPVVRRMGGMVVGAKPAKNKTQSTSARRKYSRREGSAMIDEKAFKDWDYRMDVSEFTPERCEELERIYWKTLTYAPPLYGADLMGTLFDDSTEIWNLNKLPNLLDVLGTKVPGVNTAYLYLGMWKATFAWHLEDVDLYSINYLHFGAPKQWYSISQGDARRFEAAMKSIWPTDAKACDQFLRHKAFLISPAHLQQHFNIKVNKVVSYPGEFVVTYPYGYHSGYNLGYNCAEAVNFALDSWLSMGKIAKKCECAQAQDSVWVDVYEIERKLRGDETEYEESEDDDDEDDDELDASGLPTPPSSHSTKIKAPSKKRKRPTKDKGEKKAKKIKLRVKTRKEPPCCLCPNDIPGAEILPTDDDRKAHRICALYLPETYIDTIDNQEIVANAANITKSRLDLKCLYCRSKRGACMQCSHQKCARSYHPTCAAAAGVFVEEGDVPVFGEDGTEYKEQAFEFSCRFHRTKRDKRLDSEALENDERTSQAAAALQKNDTCQVQFYKGDIFAGVVVENRTDEETLLLDVIPHGERVEVEWKWLLLPDPGDFRLPKASPNALPMPTSRKAKEQLNAKRLVDEVPRKNAPFVEGFTWAEFNSCEVANKEQKSVDVSKEDQLWYYLGEPSTEAKAQYTDDPQKPVFNPKSSFLDSIPKPPKPPKAVFVPTPTYVPTTGPIQPNSASLAPSPGPAKGEKPYVYKPRKPIDPTFDARMYAAQKLTPAVPTASPGSLRFGSDPRFQQPGGQYTQQKFEPTAPTPPSRAGPTYSSPYAMGSGQPGQNWWSSSKGFAARQQDIQQHGLHGPRPVHGAGSQQGEPSVYDKYVFFRINHNRDPRYYKTPYSTLGSGFINGYEGNLRADLMERPEALWTAGRPASHVQQTQQASYSPNSAVYAPMRGDSGGPGATSGLHANAQIRQQYAANGTSMLATGNSQDPWAGMQSLASAAHLHPSIRVDTKAMPPTTSMSAGTPTLKKSKVQNKVQYKIPEKQTPVPIPAHYLAAAAKAKACVTVKQASPQSPIELVKAESNGQLATPDPTPQGSGSQKPTDESIVATSPVTPTPEPIQVAKPAPVRISQTPIPVPQPWKMAARKQADPAPLKLPTPSLEVTTMSQPPPAARAPIVTSSIPQTNALAIMTLPLANVATLVSSTLAHDAKDDLSPPVRELSEVPVDSMGLVERMMMNLRRASEKFDKLEART